MKYILIQYLYSGIHRICIYIVFIAMFVTIPLFAQTETRIENIESRKDSKELPDILDPPKKTKPDPVPYERNENEFSLGEYYAYRFLAISVGSFPFSILLSSVLFDSYRTIDYSMQSKSFQSKYLPLFFGGAEKPVYTSDEVFSVVMIGIGVSVSIALTDLIISLVTNNAEVAIDELFENIQ